MLDGSCSTGSLKGTSCADIVLILKTPHIWPHSLSLALCLLDGSNAQFSRAKKGGGPKCRITGSSHSRPAVGYATQQHLNQTEGIRLDLIYISNLKLEKG